MLLLAVAVLALQAVGAVGFGVLLISAAGGLLAAIQPFGALLPASAIGFGAAAALAAVATLARRPWGWVLGMVAQAVVPLAVIVAALAGGWHPALAAALALGGVGAISLFHPATRQAVGI
jgi:hypothetical protein